MIICLFCQVDLTGVGFLNRTGAKRGCEFDKNAKKSFLLSYKLKNTESAQLWADGKYKNPPNYHRVTSRHHQEAGLSRRSL